MQIPWEELASDKAVVGIVAMNAIVIVGALVSGDGPLMLMWPYWMQSVVIGYYNVRRIQRLKHFTTEGLKYNGKAMDATPAARRTTWVFFAVHYGFFHLIYFMFLGAFRLIGGDAGAAEADAASGWSSVWFAAMFVGFMVSHGASHREHVDADLRGRPNLGALMFVPYVRIIPMHLTIIFGMMLGGGSLALLLFGALKTAADVAMHRVEHRLLQKAQPA